MNFLATGLTALAVLWSASIVAAPLALATGTGSQGATLVYAGASRICHQRPERSFHLHGLQTPVCARCAGLYLSGAVGTLWAWGSRRRAAAGRAVLIVVALPTAATWLLEFAGIIGFSNAARAAAALPLGGYAGWLFVRMLRYDSRLDGEQNLHG